VLLWVENEVAFIHPQTSETFKRSEVFASYPEIYAGPPDHPDKELARDGTYY
jgi:hypothetical protein